jgi:hypothetical protein
MAGRDRCRVLALARMLRGRRISIRREWLGAMFVLCLLGAETFAVTHPLDLAAHGTGEPCKICLSVASLGSGAVAAVAVFHLDTAAPTLTVAHGLVLLSAAPVRQSARGPPVLS